MATPDKFLPPHNVQAEEALLGSLIINPSAIQTVAAFLQPGDFYIVKNAWIYRAILALHERQDPVDFVTLTSELEDRGKLDEVDGASYLSRLVNAVPSALHVESYAHLIHENGVRRRVLDAASQAAQLAYDKECSLEHLLDRVEATFLQLRGQIAFQDRLRPLSAILKQVYDELEEASRQGTPLGIHTGFPDLDRFLGGFRQGNLVIVSARPTLGKTSLLLQFGASALRAGIPTVLFSLEMSSEELAQRLLAMETGIDTFRLQMGQVRDADWPILTKRTGELADLPLWVDDTPRLTTADLRAKVRRLYAEHGLGLILFDYIQLAHTSRSYPSRYQEIGEITRELKELAKELRIPVIAASQASRAVEQRADKRPTLADLRESGNQENDADVVIFIYREDAPGNQAAELIIGKHRNGPKGTAHVLWQPKRVRFVSVARDDPGSE